MDVIPLSLVLAVSTAWATIFLGFLQVRPLQLHARGILIAFGAWVLVGLTSPRALIHWYFIFALLTLIAWINVKRERLLAGKVWLSIAAGLGVSLGIVFFLQAVPILCPGNLPLRDYLLVLASIYLGGAVTGLAYVAYTVCHVSPPWPSGVPNGLGYLKLLLFLTILWDAVFMLENRTTATLRSASGADAHLLLIPMLLLPALSLLAFHSLRIRAAGRAKGLCALVGVVSFGANLFARWLVL